MQAHSFQTRVRAKNASAFTFVNEGQKFFVCPHIDEMSRLSFKIVYTLDNCLDIAIFLHKSFKRGKTNALSICSKSIQDVVGVLKATAH